MGATMMSLEEINDLASQHKIGERGTPVVSFWPMRKKWEKYGDYWEQWGFDGDPRHEIVTQKVYYVDDNDEVAWRDEDISTFKMPAILKLIYFVVPGTSTVCQVCHVYKLSSYDSGFYQERDKLVAENLKVAQRALDGMSA